VPSSDDCAEGLTNFLWELGALGVVEESQAGETARLRAFFSGSSEPAALVTSVRDYVRGLVALGLDGRDEARVAPLHDIGWAEAWREHFQPVMVGRRLVVMPPWSNAPPEGRLTVTIEPGRAFGTGHHGSTTGCLEAIEAIVEHEHPAFAIDLGTGSGILAIAAVRLGVPSIVAVDEDPDAVRCAVANAALNGAADRIRCVVAEASALAAEPAPLVMANLLSAAHRRLAGHYRRLVEKEGLLVLGGILDTEADGVGDHLRSAGFAPSARYTVDEWATLVLRREPEEPRGAPIHDRA
jgi:ribosomal protein L11 methyltransferase